MTTSNAPSSRGLISQLIPIPLDLTDQNTLQQLDALRRVLFFGGQQSVVVASAPPKSISSHHHRPLHSTPTSSNPPPPGTKLLIRLPNPAFLQPPQPQPPPPTLANQIKDKFGLLDIPTSLDSLPRHFNDKQWIDYLHFRNKEARHETEFDCPAAEEQEGDDEEPWVRIDEVDAVLTYPPCIKTSIYSSLRTFLNAEGIPPDLREALLRGIYIRVEKQEWFGGATLTNLTVITRLCSPFATPTGLEVALELRYKPPTTASAYSDLLFYVSSRPLVFDSLVQQKPEWTLIASNTYLQPPSLGHYLLDFKCWSCVEDRRTPGVSAGFVKEARRWLFGDLDGITADLISDKTLLLLVLCSVGALTVNSGQKMNDRPWLEAMVHRRFGQKNGGWKVYDLARAKEEWGRKVLRVLEEEGEEEKLGVKAEDLWAVLEKKNSAGCE